MGKSPFICVWDTTSLDTVSILQGGHERGVAALGFSGDGNVSGKGEFSIETSVRCMNMCVHLPECNSVSAYASSIQCSTLHWLAATTT